MKPGPDGRSILRAGAITGVVAVMANLVIWALASAIVEVPDRFTPLKPGSVAFLTVAGVAAAALVLLLLTSRSVDPVATFRRLVPIALLVTLVPDIAVWAAGAYQGAAKAETVVPLMLMHVAAAAICWGLLPSLAVRRSNVSRGPSPA